MTNKDCPECHGTGQYVGFNKVEPCSICVDNQPEDKFIINRKIKDIRHDNALYMFKYILQATINYFGIEHSEKIINSFAKKIDNMAIVYSMFNVRQKGEIQGYKTFIFKTYRKQNDFQLSIEYK